MIKSSHGQQALPLKPTAKIQNFSIQKSNISFFYNLSKSVLKKNITFAKTIFVHIK